MIGIGNDNGLVRMQLSGNGLVSGIPLTNLNKYFSERKVIQLEFVWTGLKNIVRL